MQRLTSIAVLCLAIAVVVIAVLYAGPRPTPLPAFSTPYQAVLLDNGQVFYGKVSKLGSAFAEINDVYYIVQTADPQTKQTKPVLVKRGKELHAPTLSYLNAHHIVMIEPVAPDSEVGKLIAKSGS